MALTDLIKNGTAGLATATTATERSADLQSVAKVAVATTVHKKMECPLKTLDGLTNCLTPLTRPLRAVQLIHRMQSLRVYG